MCEFLSTFLNVTVSFFSRIVRRVFVYACDVCWRGDTWELAQFGDTALIDAAACGHADCVRLLLDAGADTEVKDKVRVLHPYAMQ